MHFQDVRLNVSDRRGRDAPVRSASLKSLHLRQGNYPDHSQSSLFGTKHGCRAHSRFPTNSLPRPFSHTNRPGTTHPGKSFKPKRKPQAYSVASVLSHPSLRGLSRVGFLGQSLVKPLGRPMEKISCAMLLHRLPRPIHPQNLSVKALRGRFVGVEAPSRVGAGVVRMWSGGPRGRPWGEGPALHKARRAATRANPFQIAHAPGGTLNHEMSHSRRRRRVASQTKPMQPCHPERELWISRPTEIQSSRSG